MQRHSTIQIPTGRGRTAGLRIESLKGSKTSCYAGSFTGDYRDLTMHDNEGHGLYTATGTHTSLVANRVSWFYDLAGPSVTMDTACSASLTAFHLACQGMRNGESQLSLVAGTHLILGPDSTLLLGAGRILSPQGTSKAFDHRADGYGRGEGVGVVVLKPLQAALRDGDTIRAVVLGSAANHNGRTPSPSQPSSDAQMSLIRTAYEQAGVEPARCGFVEAHGTGTAVGDPLETRAIAETLGKDRTTDLYVGSAKTNIGHLESAAGMAGLIKCILVVEKGIVPPNLWFEKLNPRIQLPDHVKVPTAPVPWPGSGLRIASVNSFGFGGANAHVIIGDAYHFLHERGLSGLHRTELHPSSVVLTNGVNGHANGHTNGINGSANGTNGHTNGVNGSTGSTPPHPKLLVLSAQDKQGPERLGTQLSAYLSNPSHPSSILSDLAHTLSRRRSRLLWKSFATASSLPAAQTALSHPSRAVRSALRPRLAFVFTGQGAQWHAMGAELFAHYEPFRASIARSDATLRALGCPWTIRDELSRPADATRVNDAQLSQPLCVALQVALVDLLAHFGVRPSAVVGHSSGEMGAAYGAGALSQNAAVALAWWRGVYAARVEQAKDLDGTMLAVRAGGDAVRPRLDGLRKGMAVVGCFNSPRNCTVSGDREALEELRTLLEAEGVGATPLKVGVAYHSPHMRRIADEYREAVASAVKKAVPPPETGTVPFFSSVTGKLLPPAELGASYWVDNLVSSVNFTGAVQSMIRSARDGAVDGAAAFVDAFVEVGPHSALRTYLNEVCAAESVPASIPYSTVLRRNFSAVDSLLTAAGELWCLGADVDVERVNLTDEGARMLTDLKPYPFNHSSSYWAESAITRQYRFRQQLRTDHLGVRFDGSVTPQWRNFLKLRENPWLEHHKIKSEIVYPTIKQLADPNEQIAAFELRDLTLNDPLRILDEERGAEVMTQVKPSTTGPWADFAVVSRSEDSDWSKPHCQGKVRATYQSQITAAAQTELRWEQKKLAELYKKATIDCDRPEDAFYETLESAGCEYGPSFRNLSSLYLGDRAGRGIARVPDTKSLMPCNFEYPTVIHPATLDSFLQMAFPALTESGAALNASSTASAVAVDRVYLSADVAFSPGKEFDVFSRGKKTGGATQDVSVYALQPSSPAPAVAIEGMRIAGGTEGVESSPSLCFDTLWREDVNLLNQEQVADAIFSRAEPDPFDSEHYAMLDIVALPYIQDAVDWLQHAGKQHAPADGFLQLFYAWMVDKLRENAGLVADAAALRTKAETAVVELQNTEAGAVTVELIHRVGENLKGIMSGDVEPLEVMLKNGLLYEYYRVGLGTSFNSNVAEYMGMLAHKGAGQLRVLEIGGGTGGTTRRILDAIRTPGVASYVFTDVSPGFLGNAATNFARDAGVMQFKTLNIEEDPAAQGFAPESFDVLVCANVLHATCRIRDTLSRCRSLLKRDGRLVLAELTDNPVFMGLMMGPLPGWWLGEDDGRHGGPIITAKEWDAALKDAGFTGVDIHIRGDKNARDGLSPTALIVSTRKDERPATSNKPELRFLTDDSADAKRLAGTLQRRLAADGEKVAVLTWGSSSVLSASAVRDCYCVCLGGLRRADKKLNDLLASAAGVCWVSQDAGSSNPQRSSLPSAAVGEGKVTTVDLDPTASAVDDAVPTLHRLLTELLVSNPNAPTETAYAIRNGVAHIPRLALNDAAVPAQGQQDTIQLSQTTEPRRTQCRCQTASRWQMARRGCCRDSDGVDALPLRKNRSYFRVDLYELVKKESKALESIMDGVSELVRSGAVETAKPLSIYGAGKIETVLGYMQTGEHMGKTVIDMSTDDQVKYTPQPPRLTLHPDATYVLAGGFAAGAGRELARWLVSRGAQHLLILSESATSHTIDEGHAHSLRDDHGIQAAAIFADGPSSLDKAIQSVPKPIKGVIIGHMNQKSQHPAVAFYDLHTALRAAPVDFFIRLFSGTNTSGAAALPPNRRRSSTKNLTVTLGLGTSLPGTPPLRAVEAAIEAALVRDTAAGSNLTIITPPPAAHSATATIDADPHLHPARFGPLKQHVHRLLTAAATTTTTSSDPTATETLSAGLARVITSSSADSPPTAAAVASLVSSHLRARMARLMMVPADEVDPQRPLAAYGVDSLVAAELRNWLVKETGVNVAVTRLTRGDVAMVEVAWEVARERVGERREVVVVNGGGGAKKM
ncbi:putative polyketide synthase [Diplodia seriata]|uniref:Putative polyketide synthase n=1 Tax=Diplodia seriata TaxID=420778 RepID=A0A0G2FSY5_9PEZI|nr:putative polyketide synthase [Diplodia seriata]